MTEFALIDTFVKAFRVELSPFGPGDDCAVVAPAKHSQCVTTDAVVEDVHFTRAHFTWADVGHKALAVNLSDLAAMGAVPTWFVCALGLPPSFSRRDVVQLSKGMSALAAQHGIKLIGGNVTKSPVVSVTITAAGLARRPILRSGAQAGDVVCVTGPLGHAASGLEAMRTGRRAPLEVAAQRRPQPHVVYAPLLAQFATSAIDVSDGLVQDLGHVAKASGVAVKVAAHALPTNASLQQALTGGEDYVLAFTAAAPQRSKLERRAQALGLPLHVIGVVEAGHGVWVDGKPWRGRGGFSHR